MMKKVFNVIIYVLGLITFIGIILGLLYWLYIKLIVGVILASPIVMAEVVIGILTLLVILAYNFGKKRR
ncbi:MAG: hypothetical protein ACI4SF_16440 [Oscillospiraceae bacterium]